LINRSEEHTFSGHPVYMTKGGLQQHAYGSENVGLYPNQSKFLKYFSILVSCSNCRLQ